MHELSIVQGIVDSVMAQLERMEYNRIVNIKLDVGSLSFLSHDALSFAFEVLSKDTPLEGTELIITEIAAKVQCHECGYLGPLEMEGKDEYHKLVPIFSCPKCKGPIEIVEGRDCVVRTVDIAVDD